MRIKLKKLENYTKKSGNILSEAHQITKQRNHYFRFRLTRKYNIIIKSKSPAATTGDKIKESARRRTTSGGRWSCDDRSGAETIELRAPTGLEKKRPIGVPPISLFFQSARRESNPRPPPWQGGAPPLSHSRIVLCKMLLSQGH